MVYYFTIPDHSKNKSIFKKQPIIKSNNFHNLDDCLKSALGDRLKY
jgi:hypothetical protein